MSFLSRKASSLLPVLLAPVLSAKWRLGVPFAKDTCQIISNSKWIYEKLKTVHEPLETGKRGKVSWREPYNFAPAEEIDKLYIVLRLTRCIKTNPAASFSDKHSFGVPWTVFSNTNVQSNPVTLSKWADLAVETDFASSFPCSIRLGRGKTLLLKV